MEKPSEARYNALGLRMPGRVFLSLGVTTMTKISEQKSDCARASRRAFLTRNLLAAGGIAATAITRSTSANAGCDGHAVGGRGSCFARHTPSCFLKGTRIRTTAGDRPVEDLKAGDLVSTLFGGSRPIEWVGRYSYTRSGSEGSWEKRFLPVRISRSAIANNVPERDLFVTSGHGLYIDGAIIPAGNLVNGSTIRIDEAETVDELEYFHIKLESHDVVLAEGLASETMLVDSETAAVSAAIAGAAVASTTEKPCAPLMYYSGRRGQIVSRLRSAISPWIDFRKQLDVIRDRLDDRADSLYQKA